MREGFSVQVSGSEVLADTRHLKPSSMLLETGALDNVQYESCSLFVSLLALNSGGVSESHIVWRTR